MCLLGNVEIGSPMIYMCSRRKSETNLKPYLQAFIFISLSNTASGAEFNSTEVKWRYFENICKREVSSKYSAATTRQFKL